MKKVATLLLFISFNALAQGFPIRPDPRLTTGSLCTTPTSYRFAERIPYCERDVSSETKDLVFKNYAKLGYKFKPGERSSYKIDHFIPLCFGGSNHPNNLWPQHVSVFTVTDPIESVGCDKLRDNKIKQKELISIIRAVKNDLSLAPDALRRLLAR